MRNPQIVAWIDSNEYVTVKQHVLVELLDETMVSGHFCVDGAANDASDIYFVPDHHGNDEKSLDAKVDIDAVVRWAVYPSREDLW